VVREATAQPISSSAAAAARSRVVPSARPALPILVSNAKRFAIGSAARRTDCVTLGGAGSGGSRRIRKAPFTLSADQYLATTGPLPTGALPTVVQPATPRTATTAAMTMRDFFIFSPVLERERKKDSAPICAATINQANRAGQGKPRKKAPAISCRGPHLELDVS